MDNKYYVTIAYIVDDKQYFESIIVKYDKITERNVFDFKNVCAFEFMKIIKCSSIQVISWQKFEK